MATTASFESAAADDGEAAEEEEEAVGEEWAHGCSKE
jgi:hypothetical protein